MLAAAKEQAHALPSAFHGVDLFITTSPPPSLSLLSPSFPTSGISLGTAAPPLAEIIKLARPRYLFWADGEGFWEREPFGWAGVKGEERWTRAVKLGALAAVGKGAGKPARVSGYASCRNQALTNTVVLRYQSPSSDGDD